MTRHTYGKLLRCLLTFFILIVVILLLVFTFADGQTVPNWETLYALFEGKSLSQQDVTADYFRVIDVGEGDTLLFVSNGKNMLLDVGPNDYSAELCSRLQSYGLRKIDLLSYSHLDSDHTGGTPALVQSFSIEQLLLPDTVVLSGGGAFVADAWAAVQANGNGCYTAVPGMTITLGDFVLTVLYCDPTQEESNNRSAVMMAAIGNSKILLTGDIGTEIESVLVQTLRLDCDILKVAHHGSKYSSSDAFLAACSPESAVITCGADNSYGHPTEEVLSALEQQDAEIYRTDLNGDVTFIFDDTSYTVQTER